MTCLLHSNLVDRFKIYASFFSTRLGRAIVFVFALIVSVPLIDYFVNKASSLDAYDEMLAIQFDEESALTQDDPIAVIDELDEELAKYQVEDIEELDGAFRNEIGVLADAENLRYDDENNIVSYEINGDIDAIITDVAQSLEEKGWTTIPLGDVAGSSFVKEDGELNWALVTGSQQEEKTNIVIRVIRS